MAINLSIVDAKLRNPRVPLTELEQSAFCQVEPLETKPLAEELNAGVRWQRLPDSYVNMTPEELTTRIEANKVQLGSRAVILGHHYQREDIIQFADFRGDSLKLSQYAADQQGSEFIIFCGVHFMAETAAVLGGAHQKVVLPNINAGCSMADMAPTDDALDCWDDLMTTLGTGSVIPVTYMNSTAEIKALVGENGGAVCTSSNADRVVAWAFQQGKRVLFLPDQHLGRNTGAKMGVPLDEMVLWNPFQPLGGNTAEALERSKMILWKGHCSVHTRFTTDQIARARQGYPDVQVIVHPECMLESVQEADYVGSTELIVKMVSESAPGSVWAIGTEINLVSRLAHENPDKTVFCLDPVVCPCSTMYRIHPAYLLWVTDELLAGRVPNQVSVAPETAHYAKVALDRMLSLS
ncbi:MAG: quinolinate synthase NadA [Chloroflexota bacterium]|nr:quinolinate synthase NadA [Chloroflexota bacterium]